MKFPKRTSISVKILLCIRHIPTYSQEHNTIDRNPLLYVDLCDVAILSEFFPPFPTFSFQFLAFPIPILRLFELEFY